MEFNDNLLKLFSHIFDNSQRESIGSEKAIFFSIDQQFKEVKQ